MNSSRQLIPEGIRSTFSRRWQILLAVFLALAVIGVAGYLGLRSAQADNPPAVVAPPTVPVSRGDVVQSVTAPGQSVGTQESSLSMGVSGPLAEVDVLPGDVVKKGQVLARMGDREKFAAALSNAQLQELQAQKAYDDLVANAPQATAQAQIALIQAQQALQDAQNKRDSLTYPRASQSRIDDLQSAYQGALQNLALAQNAYNLVANKPPDDPTRINALRALTAAQTAKDNSLATLNFVTSRPTTDEVAQAGAELAQAQANVDAAQRAWDSVKDGPDAHSLQLAQYTLSNAQATVAQAQADLQHLDLTAPFDGVVLDVQATPGQTVSADAPILTLANPQAMEVDASVVEEDFPLVAVGQKATLYFDALPDVDVTGVVTRIIPKRLSGNQANYSIAIRLDSIPAHLVEGMSVDASIIIDQRSNALRLPRTAIRPRADGSATVDVWANGHTEKREVKAGLRGDSYTEILSGLSEGDQVVAN